jgi:hypothetical protein
MRGLSFTVSPVSQNLKEISNNELIVEYVTGAEITKPPVCMRNRDGLIHY